MASLPFVGTPESDDDVDQLDNESDRDEEPEKVYRRATLKPANRKPESRTGNRNPETRNWQPESRIQLS